MLDPVVERFVHAIQNARTWRAHLKAFARTTGEASADSVEHILRHLREHQPQIAEQLERLLNARRQHRRLPLRT